MFSAEAANGLLEYRMTLALNAYMTKAVAIEEMEEAIKMVFRPHGSL